VEHAVERGVLFKHPAQRCGVPDVAARERRVAHELGPAGAQIVNDNRTVPRCENRPQGMTSDIARATCNQHVSQARTSASVGEPSQNVCKRGIVAI
jgi:hypothetical protein